MNRLIVARYEENLDWLPRLKGWQPLVVQKGKDLPNVGREASSWLWGLHKLYPKLHDDDLVACVQGNPFDHCPTLLEDLAQPTQGFRWLGDSGYTTDAQGRPYHNGLTMGETRLAWLGQPWDGTVFFAAGGQFVATGALVKRLPRKFYGWLQQQVCAHPQGPWIIERLWEKLFVGDVQPVQRKERVMQVSDEIAAQIEALGWQYSPNEGVGSPSARKMVEPGNCQDLSSNTPEQLLEAVRETERQMGAQGG